MVWEFDLPWMYSGGYIVGAHGDPSDNTGACVASNSSKTPSDLAGFPFSFSFAVVVALLNTLIFGSR